MRILLLHQNGNVMGNILWPRTPTPEENETLLAGGERLRRRGYWVGFFPEGDGISFSREGEEYNQAQALVDLSESFAPIQVVERDGSGGRVSLADLVDDDQSSIQIKYLVPVDQLLLCESFSIGGTHFHAPVDGDDVVLERHPWGMELCDVPGADVEPGWAPRKTEGICGTNELLAYPLIERKINIPSRIYHARKNDIRSMENFINYLISDADRALDMLRWALCSYKKLEYLPGKAGWIGDFAYAYIEPMFGPAKGELVSAKPNVLRVANNWLGLEAQVLDIDSVAPVAGVVDGTWVSELAPALKAALRTFGQAYYLTEPEASFLSMLYATDALAGVRKLTGFHQRIWVAAAASKGRVDLFEEILQKFIELYKIRNGIVHNGRSFVEMDQDPRQVNQDMSRILCLCVENVYEGNFHSAEEYGAEIKKRLNKPEFVSISCAHPMAVDSKVRYPIEDDDKIRKMM